jgi:uncharacterized protein with HEPN domain
MSSKDPYLYLQQISDSISLIKEYTEGFSKKTFCEDHKTIDAVLMQIIVIGEVCSRLHLIKYSETQPSIPWSKIRGMRNLIAHDYARVDPEEVWNAVTIIITEFATQISSLIDDSH